MLKSQKHQNIRIAELTTLKAGNAGNKDARASPWVWALQCKAQRHKTGYWGNSRLIGRGQNRKPKSLNCYCSKSPQTGRLQEFHIILCICHRMAIQVSAPIKGKMKFLYLGVWFHLMFCCSKSQEYFRLISKAWEVTNGLFIHNQLSS